MGLTLDQMQLAPHVRENAERLRQEFGGVIQFTSGYRDLFPQAKAMAVNVLQNRRWIEQTYRRVGRPSYFMGRQLQAWVDAHPEIESVGELTQALFEQLHAMPQGRLISYHCWRINGLPAALALDLEPIESEGHITAMGQEVWDFVKRLPHLDPPPLRREGGMPRWHVQFKPLDGSVQV